MRKNFKTPVLFTVFVLMLLSCKKDVNSKNENSDTNHLRSYIENVNHQVSKLSPERKQRREKWLKDLKSNPIYIDLVDNSSISEIYLPVLNAISDAIKNSYSIDGVSQFGISEDVATYIENSDDGEQKMKFIAIVSCLSMKMNGGLPEQIVYVFDRYKENYNLYGVDGTNIYDATGKKIKIDKAYNLSYAFALFNPKDKKVLDAIYESTEKGISQWNENNDKVYENKFMAIKSDYMEHLKKIYPDSSYLLNVDFEISSSELYRAYKANEVSADEKYKGRKLAITGTIESIGKDIIKNPYVSFKEDYLQGITCYFSENDNKIIAQLSKGEEITIIGECRGLTLTNVVIRNCKLN